MLRRSLAPLARAVSAAASLVAPPAPSFHWQEFANKETYLDSVERLLSDPKLAEMKSVWDKKAMRFFRLDQAMPNAARNDAIIAVQETNAAFSFRVMKGMSAQDIAHYVLVTPITARNLHVVTGRPGVPCDFFADIDMPLRVDPERKLLQMMEIVFHELEHRGMHPTHMLLLTGNARTKHSYHLHVHCAGAVFADYTCVRRLIETVNHVVGGSYIDTQQTRRNGQLRMMLCPKLDDPTRILTPATMKDPAFKRYLYSHDHLSAPEMIELSLVHRQIQEESESTPLLICTKGHHAVVDEAEPGKTCSGSEQTSAVAHKKTDGKHVEQVPEEVVSATLEANGTKNPGTAENKRILNRHLTPEQLGMEYAANAKAPKHLKAWCKGARFKEVCRRVDSLPRELAEDYGTWIAVGLSLFSFTDDLHAFNVWVNFSRKAPTKFDHAKCKRAWDITFPKRRDCHTWRRGYNYIRHSLKKKYPGLRKW